VAKAQGARRPLVPWLFIGDLIVLLVFVGLGMTSHRTWDGPWSLLPTALPFALAWVAWGLVVGAFRPAALRSPGAAIARGLFAWVLTVPTGLLLRVLILNRGPSLIFGLVAFTLGGMMLVAWRGLAGWTASRRSRHR